MQKLKKILPILDFGLICFFITDLWIFLYIYLLKFLNTLIPPKIPDIGFIRMSIELSPEPQEIPLYLVLSVTLVLMILFFFRFADLKIFTRLHPRIKCLLLFIFILVFFRNIGSYPLAHEIPPYHLKENAQTEQLILFFYLLISLLIIIESALLEKLMKLSAKIFIIFSIFIITFLIIVTFEPRFPMFAIDYSLFFGPIWELAHGKTIYTQVPSLYGFLSTLLLTFLFKLRILNLWYLPMLVWILYVVQYYLSFYLLFKVSQSLPFSILGLLSILTLNYFSLYHFPSAIPQIGPMRWLPLMIALLLFYKIRKIDSKPFIFFIALLSFWNIDNGIALLSSYTFTLLLLTFILKKNLKQTIKSILWLTLSLAIIFALIQLVHMLLGYQLVNIQLMLLKITQYARAGFGMWPIDSKNYFWFVILTYFATIIYFFRKNNKTNLNQQETRYKQYSNNNNQSSKLFDKLRFETWNFFGNWKLEIGNSEKVLLFSANLSLFASVYYVGRSHPHNLFHISLIFLLNFFLLTAMLVRSINSSTLKLAIFVVLFFLFILFPIVSRQESLAVVTKERINKLAMGNIFTPESKKILEAKYQKDINLIKSELKGEKVLILSDDDVYLLYLTNKQNLMDYNPQLLNFTKNDFNLSLQEALHTCPRKIVGDCRLFNKCNWSDPFIPTNLFIQPLLLEKIENVCKMRYQATDCTKHLCIAVVNK